MTNNNLLFFVLSSRHGWYEYIAPYIFYVQVTNPESKLEVVVDDLELVLSNHAQEIEFLEQNFRGKYHIRENKKVIDDKHFRLIRNALRFLEEPEIKCEYTYIGDIDVMVTENIKDYHVNKMKETGLPFSNQLKRDNGYDMLTGLHFYKTNEFSRVYDNLDKYYSMLPKFGCDQQLLYHIMKDNFNMDNNLLLEKRPIHGIHMSRSRPNPLGNNFGWNINIDTVKGYETIKKHPLWDKFYSIVSFEYKEKLIELDGYINEFKSN